MHTIIQKSHCSCKNTIKYFRNLSISNAKRKGPSTSRLRFEKARENRPIAPGEYALLTIPMVTFGLGVWQTERLSWKKDLMKKLENKSAEEAVELPYELKRIEELEFQKVKVRGTFDHSKEQYIGPRSLIHDGEAGESQGLMGSSEGIGYHVITPFHIDGGEHHGNVILVNRGWVHSKLVNPETREQAQVSGMIEIEGVVRTTEQRQQFTPKLSQNGNKWPWRDIPGLAYKLGTEEIFIDADLKSSTAGGPIGGQSRVKLRNDHFSYLLTWFGLSACTLFMWCQKYIVK